MHEHWIHLQATIFKKKKKTLFSKNILYTDYFGTKCKVFKIKASKRLILVALHFFFFLCICIPNTEFIVQDNNIKVYFLKVANCTKYSDSKKKVSNQNLQNSCLHT